MKLNMLADLVQEDANEYSSESDVVATLLTSAFIGVMMYLNHRNEIKLYNL